MPKSAFQAVNTYLNIAPEATLKEAMDEAKQLQETFEARGLDTLISFRHEGTLYVLATPMENPMCSRILSGAYPGL
jgi:hypothetical protein